MITNQTPDRVRYVLSPETSVLYEPAPDDWSYSHHASLCVFGGKLYAIWSNGKIDEDDVDQRVLCSVSEDRKRWSKPFALFDSAPDNTVLTAAGMLVHEGKLAAYAGSYQYEDEVIQNGKVTQLAQGHKNTTLLAKTTMDGVHWSDAVDLKIPIVPNHGPEALASGRVLICGNVSFPYTDVPDGLSGWNMSGLPPFPWPNQFDDSEGFWRHMELRGDGAGLCEGSHFQTDDGVIHMLLRSHERWLFLSESKDDGATWSKPIKTKFTDCGTKFHCGRLPDGRFYVVGSPDPACSRCPLVISLSEDGETFDREYVITGEYRPLRVPGKHKGGIYGYPHTIIEDQVMRVICSVNKEDVYVFSFPLAQLNR